MALRETAPDIISGTSIEHVAPVLDEEIGGLPSDRDFVAMRAAYRATGDTARGDDLARLPVAALASRPIVVARY